MPAPLPPAARRGNEVPLTRPRFADNKNPHQYVRPQPGGPDMAKKVTFGGTAFPFGANAPKAKGKPKRKAAGKKGSAGGGS